MSEPKSIRDNAIQKTMNIIGSSSVITAATILATASANPRSMLAYADGDSTATDESQFTTTESGLKYYDIKIGTGEVPKAGDPVRVHYTGMLLFLSLCAKVHSHRSPFSMYDT